MNNRFKTKEAAIKYLEELGFHNYQLSPLAHSGIVANLQKVFRDDKGKKYFLDANVWDMYETSLPDRYVIEYWCQLYEKGTHDAFDLTFIDQTCEQAEKLIEELFDADLVEYYEEWD